MSDTSHSSIVKPMQAHETLNDYHPEEHTEHTHGGLGKYIVVFFLLCFATGLSFLTFTSWWPFKGEANRHITWTFMMAVSCFKAMLVILFFMHVKYEANWKYVLTIPAGMMSVFLVLMLIPDVGLRGRTATPERRLYMATESDKKFHHISHDEHADPSKTPAHK
jgi:cytochrome c oxidase subunit IV